jgi:hypothetical protein
MVSGGSVVVSDEILVAVGIVGTSGGGDSGGGGVVASVVAGPAVAVWIVWAGGGRYAGWVLVLRGGGRKGEDESDLVHLTIASLESQSKYLMSFLVPACSYITADASAVLPFMHCKCNAEPKWV